MQHPTQRPVGLTMAGLWTGALGVIMAAFFGLSLLGTFAPSDFPADSITTGETTRIAVNLIAGVLGVVIGFALLRRWQSSFGLGLLFHVFMLGNVIINGVAYLASSIDPMRTIVVIGGGVISLLSLLIVIYLGTERGRRSAPTS